MADAAKPDLDDLLLADHERGFELLPGEVYWRDRYGWLLDQGYQLSQRYHPKWVPSWETNKSLVPGLTLDSQVLPNARVIDATRTKDQTPVILKLVESAQSPEEVDILGYFSQAPISSDPRNHICPLLDILRRPEDEGQTIVVLPVLRPYDNPDFDTIGEALDFLRQILEGFTFLHEHRVAHRDVRSENLMLDPTGMYPAKFFVWTPNMKADYSGPIQPRYMRTERGPKYYIIDFGFSKQFNSEELPPSEIPMAASDPTIPELNDPKPCDPFPIDVYTVGNLILTDFIEGKPWNIEYKGRRGFDFLLPLVNTMVSVEPSERPSMKEALDKFNEIVGTQTPWTLRSRALPKDKEPLLTRVPAEVNHWKRRLWYITRRLPPIPVHKVKEDKTPKAPAESD
ncbi:other/AgaK1 protein kinase [Coprinellus micaceus]|uniref:Other/AgaK1 protein kinase n=1 Tax=Coprinellus micaceus TaxID=71717 RepID=A0A4Y7SNM8_COPMI|nr:other/AgaK1 protein kinase [Coprinellus micaceus]